MFSFHVNTADETILLKLEESVHRNNPCVKILFRYNDELIEKVKALHGRRWSKSMHCWYIPYREDYREYLEKKLQVHSEQTKRNSSLKKQKNGTKTQQSATPSAKVIISIDKKQKQFFIQHSFDTKLYGWLQEFDGGVWNRSKKHWEFNGDNAIYKKITAFLQSENYAWVREEIKNNKAQQKDSKLFIDSLPNKGKNLPSPLKEYVKTMTLKRLSQITQKTYYRFFMHFYHANKDRDVLHFSYNTIYDYIRQESKVLNQTQLNQTIAAIKFYYEKVLGKDKMMFFLKKPVNIIKDFVYIPYYEFEKICCGIPSASDTLLLFLVYCIHLPLKKICCLPLDISENVIEDMIVSRGEEAKQYFKDLLHIHKNKHSNQKYLLEEKGHAYKETNLEIKLNRILGNYHLKEIYKLQYKQILASTEYSASTRGMYLSLFMKFLETNRYKHPMFISDEEARDYLVIHRDKSASLQNMQINAFKFFFEKVHNKELAQNNVARPRRSFTLPKVLHKEEIAAIISNIDNVKHRLLISLAYCAGLRRQELQSLAPEDIKLDENILQIRSSKGNKDRITPLSEDLHQLIRDYLEMYKPKRYFFEGDKRGTKYSFTSMAKVLKNAAKAAGIHRNVHLHMLRHSYSTHVLEDGYDVSYLKTLLGHKDIKTTMRYTHLVNNALKTVKSPFESLPIDKKYLKAKKGQSP